SAALQYSIAFHSSLPQYSPSPSNPSIHQSLQSARGRKQLRQLALAALQVRVAANVLGADEDVGHRSLARQLRERGLVLGAVVCFGVVCLVNCFFFFVGGNEPI